LGAVAGERADEAAVGEECVAGFDDAELVAFGVGEDYVAFFRELPDVDVLGAEFECSGHGLLLVFQGCARQVEVGLVGCGLLLLGGEPSDGEAGVVVGQEGDAVVGVVGHLPVQDSGPEACEVAWVVRVEAECDEV
jgi:hypothetical protein